MHAIEKWLRKRVSEVLSERSADGTGAQAATSRIGDLAYATVEWSQLLKGRSREIFKTLFRCSGEEFCHNSSVGVLAATLYVRRRDECKLLSTSDRADALKAAFEGGCAGACCGARREARALQHGELARARTLEHGEPARARTQEHGKPARACALEHAQPARARTFEHGEPARARTLEHAELARARTFEHGELAKAHFSPANEPSRARTLEYGEPARAR